jgi:ornithine cyclodeaminase
MLVLSRRDVEALLDVDALIEALESAMADLSAGRASVPDRVGAMVLERSALLGAMAGYVPSAGALVAKLVTLFPENADGALPTHQAVIACFDPNDGEPLALLDGTYITATRTGACSALSARLLAREDAEILAVIGTGVQARSHARALCRVRPIGEIRVAGRNPEKAKALTAEISAELDLDASAASSYAEALSGADIVCATTHSLEPVIRREWLADGTHVTSVGYNPAGRELDDETVRDARVFVETRRAALAPVPSGSNDLIDPEQTGLISEDEIAELGEVIAGTRPGRGSDEEITLYKSVGVAAQDAASAALVLNAAREQRAGSEVEL